MSEIIKILYVEDNPDDADLMNLTLSKSDLDFRLITSCDLKAIIPEISQNQIDLVISDYDLRGFNGNDVIAEVRAYDPILPIIVISGTVGEENAAKLIKDGANDFFLKDNIKEIPKEILKTLDLAKTKRQAQHYQEQLERQSNILEAVFDSLDDFIFLKDSEKKYLKVNKSMANNFGIDTTHFEGKLARQLYPSEDEISRDQQNKSDQTDEEVLTKGKTLQYETDYYNEKGDRVVLETVKSPIVEKGEISGLVGLSRNITAKKIAIDNLNKSQQILNSAESITQSASFQYSPNSDLISVSQNFHKLMGSDTASPHFALSKFKQLVYDADLPLFEQELENALKKHIKFEMEIRYGKSPNIRFGKIQMFPDLSLNSPLFFGTIMDITDNRLNYQALDTAQEKERKLIARELHDNVGQKLTAAKIFLNHLNDQPDSNGVLTKIDQLINQSIQDIRALSREVSIELVKENGLRDALIQLINFVPGDLKIELDLQYDDHVLNTQIAGNIFRIVQEALNNTLKYADAKDFSIQLHQFDAYLQLTICDNGKGFDLKTDISKNGLKNIEQRVKTCHGVLKINSSPGMGTTISVKVPRN